jgi:octaprenyl-diphosphate synthase
LNFDSFPRLSVVKAANEKCINKLRQNKRGQNEMSKANSESFEKLKASLKERSRIVQERFTNAAVEDVTNPALLEILNDLQSSQPNVIRTGLVSLSCEAVGGDPELTQDFSLMLLLSCVGIGIHDDIIDKSVYTRFKKSVPALYGSKKALLVGDLLIVKSWGITQKLIARKIEPKLIAQTIDGFRKSNIELCEAEMDEILYGRRFSTSLAKRKEILWKINGILEACARGGAILGGGKASEIVALGDFGRRIGFLFALMDEVKDTLNLDGSLIHRLKYESIPFPMFYAAKSSINARLRIKGVLKKTKTTVSDVDELVDCCFDTGAFAYIKEVATENKTKAIDSLSSIKWNSSVSMLKLLMDKSFGDLVDFFC